MNVTLDRTKTEQEVQPYDLAHELLRVSTGQHPDASEEAALVLSTAAILSIKRYEKLGLALPKNLDEVKAQLGGVVSTEPGLTNEELLVTYEAITANADTWLDLEREIYNTAVHLDLFADVMMAMGPKCDVYLGQIITKYSGIENIDPEKLSDPEYLEKIMSEIDPDQELTEEDANTLSLVTTTMDVIAEKAASYSKTTTDVKNNIFTFRDGMKDCRADVNKKQNLIDELDLEQELVDLKDKRDRKMEEIYQLEEDYDKQVNMMWTGIIAGPIGLAVSGGICGSNAAEIQDNIDKLYKEVDELDEEIATLDALINAIKTLDTHLGSMEASMAQAEIGILQIESVWLTIDAILKDCKESVNTMQSAQSLAEYWAYWTLVYIGWSDVNANAAICVKQFQEALEEWNEENARIDRLNAERLVQRKVRKTLRAVKDSELISLLPSIDSQLIDDSYNTIRKATAGLTSEEYASLIEICEAIEKEVSKAVDNIREANIQVASQASVNSAFLYKLNVLILSLEEQLEGATPAEQEKILEEIAGHREIGDKEIAKHLTDVQAHAETITSNVVNIEFYQFSAQLDDEQKKLQEQLEHIDTQIEATNEKYAKAEAEYNALVEALEIMREYSLWDYFGDVIPSPKEIYSLIKYGVPASKVKVIAYAVEVYASLVHVIGDGFSYMQMVEARQFMFEEMERFAAELEDLKSQRNDVVNQNECVVNMSIVETERFVFTDEAKKEPEAFDIYQQFVNDLLENETNYSKTITALNDMNVYLTNLQ